MILKKHYVSSDTTEFEEIDSASFIRSDAVNVVKSESNTILQITRSEHTDIVVTLIDCGQVIFEVVLKKIEGDI